MADATAAAWAHVILQTFEILGGICGSIGGLALLLARRTFATRDDLSRAIADHAQEHQRLDQRLANGENRFTALSGSIDMVRMAAEQARDAADQARDAADRIQMIHVELAELRGDFKSVEAKLQPLERLTMGMVEGHMAEGRNSGRNRL
jgi:chromosome segregation ATPase